MSPDPATRRHHPLLRLWLATYAGLVLVMGTSLYFLAGDTDRFFAWTIDTPITATYLGASALAAVPTAWLCARETVWANGRSLLWGSCVATAALDVTTLIHLDLFHLDGVTGWLWVIVYAAGTVMLAAAVALQLREPGSDPPRDAPLPPGLRLVLVAQAVVAVTVGLILFLSPGHAGDVWPWQLPPLGSRAIGAWALAVGALVAQVAAEDDWRRVRPAMFYFALFGLLQLVALARYGESVDWGAVSSYAYVAFVAILMAEGVYGLVVQPRTSSLGSAPAS